MCGDHGLHHLHGRRGKTVARAIDIEDGDARQVSPPGALDQGVYVAGIGEFASSAVAFQFGPARHAARGQRRQQPRLIDGDAEMPDQRIHPGVEPLLAFGAFGFQFRHAGAEPDDFIEVWVRAGHVLGGSQKQ